MKRKNTSVKKFVISSAFVAGAMLAVPTVGEAALGDRTLSHGTSHNDVKELQDVLKSKGYFTYHTSTGYFGDITKDALIRFQRAQNLPQTGVADERTLRALTTQSSNSVSNTTNSSGALATNQLLRNGSRGAQVSTLQEKLNAAGHDAGAVDGVFGPVTERAVRSFQQAKGLVVDGLAGVQTLTALNGGNTAAAPTPTTEEKPVKEEKPAAESQQQANSNSSILRKGSKGQAVTKLQSDLKRLGFFAANATGLYGDITVEAVKRFQRQHGLLVDGIAGSQTFTKVSRLINDKNDGDGSQVTEDFNIMNVIADASELLGVPYVWGGNTPQQGFDCSGFICYVFKQSDVHLPRTVAQMWNVGKSVTTPAVGDIVFYETYQKGPSHAGIYIGNNKFIQAGTSTGVTISDMNSTYWAPKYLGAKRVH